MIPSEAYYKCIDKNERIEELEQFIANEAVWSFYYSSDVIKGPFTLGEKIIATRPDYSYRYAVSILNGPFTLGHPIIFNSDYKKDYIKFLKSINYDLYEIYEQYGEWLI